MTFVNSYPLQQQQQQQQTIPSTASISRGAVAENETENADNLLPPKTKKMKRGAFFVLEGVDRCGKTTQCSLLLKHLVHTLSLSAVAYRFPDRTTPIGQMINSYLLNKSEMDDHSIHLLFSANRWEASNGLVKHLTEGTSVVCDRYAYSGVAFSAAKVKCNTARMVNDPILQGESSTLQEEEEPLLNFDWCQSSDVGLPAPDAIIFLDLTQEEAEKRGGFGAERYEQRDMQIRVRRRFEQLQAQDEADSVNGTPWYVIDAAQSVDKVHLDLQQVVQTTMTKVNNGAPLRKLWSLSDKN